MRPKKLAVEQIDEQMKGVPSWRLAGDEIWRVYPFADFVQAMAFVNSVAAAAEAANHHPDIDIRYNKVRLALSTHDAGGLTLNDFDLARKADELFDA